MSTQYDCRSVRSIVKLVMNKWASPVRMLPINSCTCQFDTWAGNTMGNEQVVLLLKGAPDKPTTHTGPGVGSEAVGVRNHNTFSGSRTQWHHKAFQGDLSDFAGNFSICTECMHSTWHRKLSQNIKHSAAWTLINSTKEPTTNSLLPPINTLQQHFKRKMSRFTFFSSFFGNPFKHLNCLLEWPSLFPWGG